ncbi:MAG: hypothetical protein LQ341_002605 [Variospora aurantia]|nr:MAG: hypothetical protein LQ341_002605 [Variospora aurantia]
MIRSVAGIENNPQRLSLLSRLNNTFAPKKPRNVSEYSIELEEPYRTFAPGERIRGHVILTVERPVRITHLTICLHGVVKVLKNGRIPGESTNRWRSYLATGQGKWGEAYFGNGLAALFKDEVVLAGDGCLTASSYRFNFDLELPTNRLPSSIDFQHGCISYMLSSTLTRPASLMPSNFLPTSRSEIIVTVKDMIDVAHLPDPTPQVIPLDSIHRKPRRTKTTVASQGSKSPQAEQTHEPWTQVVPGSVISEASDGSQQSPSMSDSSCVSMVDSSRNHVENGSDFEARRASTNIDGHSTGSSDEATTASSATVEMLQSGCLPGDTVSVKVSINFGKHFKNPEGIILTLYRECHIDIHPAIPLGSWQNGRKQQYEDYYPKSRTGLGGLSLSSGGSSRIFRQDISQKSTALYVDKHTCSSTVKASVHVPDGVFPTISTVPGKMIDFKYYVETIIDLRSKSAIQERILPRLSMVNAVSSFSPSESGLDPRATYEAEKLPMNSGLAFLDTSQLRREKGVVTHISEIVVGTRDSRRGRLRKADHRQGQGELQAEDSPEYTSPTYDDVPNSESFSHPNPGNLHQNVDLEDSHAIDFAPIYDVPTPDVEDYVDEKTRLRRAEELLLPSAPPQDGEPTSSDDTGQPSAPAAFEEQDFMPGLSAPAYDGVLATSHCNSTIAASQASAAYSHEGNVMSGDQEDKQELERRRLQALASSPNASPIVKASDLEASAPVLNEDILAEHMAESSQSSGHELHEENLPRKHTGALIPPLFTVETSQLRWANPSDGIAAAEPYKEFSSSKGVYRGFCSACGTSYTWRSEERPDVIELFVGTIDEKWLIGDRTEKVSSESLTEPGVFEKVLSADEGAFGREICTPRVGQMFQRNAIKGVTDGKMGGKSLDFSMGKYSESEGWADVVPIPQNEGGPNPLAAIAYSEEYREAMEYLRAVMASDEKSERVLELTEHIISMNPAHYTVWLYRANTLFEIQKETQSDLQGDILEELRWLDGISLRHLKNYQIWHHRQTLMSHLPSLPSTELPFLARMFAKDAKNYHVWSYRQWLVRHFSLWDTELPYIETLLATDVRNNSAWNHRWYVLFGQHVDPNSGKGMDEVGNIVDEDLIDKEVEYAQAKIRLAPQNQSPWNYLRGLLRKRGSLLECKGFAEEFVGDVDGDGKGCRSSHALDFLADCWAEEKEAEKAGKALELLAKRFDPIRKNYWNYRRGLLGLGAVEA